MELIPHYPKQPLSIKDRLRNYGFDMMQWERIIIQWDREIGTIINIKQLHNDFENPEAMARENPRKYRQLIQYQKAIYGELASRKIEHIFVEWLSPIDAEKNLIAWKKRMEIEIKDTYKRDTIFANYWWAFVYFLEHPHARLYPTESQSIIDRIMTAKMNPLWGRDLRNLHIEREYHVIWQIKSFFQASPWKEVALIFWAQHDFSKKISLLFSPTNPQQEKISFLQIAKEYVKTE